MRGRGALAALAAAGLFTVGACSAPRPNIPAALSETGQTTTTAAPTTTPTTASPPCGNPVTSIQPTGPLPPPGQMPPGSFMAKIAQRGRLIAGVDPSTQLFSSRNAFSGQLEGFDIDMLHLVAQAIFGDPNKIEFHVINYAQRLPVLKDNTVDIVADTMTINCARWAQIDFSSEYFHAGQKVMVRSDSTATGIDSLAASHAKVCVAKGSTNIDELNKHPGVVAVPVDDLGSCLVLFQQATVDAVTADDTVLLGFQSEDPYAKIVGSRFTDEPYGLGVNQAHPEFVRFINSILERIRADGTWKTLYAHWLGSKNGIPEPPPAVYGRPG